MVNYQNGKIYQIVNNQNDSIYVGSTTQSLAQRFCHHKQRSQVMSASSPFYQAIRKIRVDNFRIVLIKYYPSASKIELEAEEYRIIKQHIAENLNLYNQFTGVHSQRTKSKISNTKMGQLLSAETKKRIRLVKQQRGCVYYQKSHDVFAFQTTKYGKRKRLASFTCKRHGHQLAKFFALVAQEMKYPSGATTEQLLELSKQ